MLVYLQLIVFAVVFGFVLRPERSASFKKTYLLVTFSAIFFVASVRSSSVGIDTEMHCRAFLSASRLPFSSLVEMTDRFEYGFLLFCKVLSLISGDFQILLVASSAVICLCTALFIFKLADEPILPTVLFLCLLFPSYLNIMREAIAIAIGMLAIIVLRDRKVPVFILLVFLAASFHRSALVLFALIPLSKVEINLMSMTVLIIGAIFSFLFVNPLLNAVAAVLGKNSFYDADFMGSNYFGALISLLFNALLVGIFFNYLKVADRAEGVAQGKSVSLALRWGELLWLVFSAVGMKVQIVARFGYYFAPLVLVALPLVLKAANDGETRFVRFSLIAISVIYFVVVQLFRPEWYGIVPYTADLSRFMSLFY